MIASNNILTELGFTALESDIYVFLLREVRASGYRIAHGINKPVANTYKALQSLAQKGAVLFEEGDSKMCRPVPLDELLGKIDREFKERIRIARDTLANAQPQLSDQRIYQLQTPEQVFDRCRAILDAATSVVLVDAFPKPLENLRDDLIRTTSRGVTTGIKAYKAADIPGTTLVHIASGDEVLNRWPCQWLNMVVDGRTYVMALMDAPGQLTLHAVWSESAYLSWVYHSALSNEIRMAAVNSLLSGPVSVEDIRKVIRGLEPIMARDAPGYYALRSLITPRSIQE